MSTSCIKGWPGLILNTYFSGTMENSWGVFLFWGIEFFYYGFCV